MKNFILLYFLLLIGCVPSSNNFLNSEKDFSTSLVSNDFVSNLISPTTAYSNDNINVSFDYSTSTNREIRVTLKDTSTWHTYSEVFLKINGSGTKKVSLNFSNIDITKNYIIEVKLFEANTWKVLSEINKPITFKINNSKNGFYIENGKIFDAKGYNFIMRGINHAHTWFPDKLDSTLKNISDTNANTVRIVLSNGQKWTKTSKDELKTIINKIKLNHLIGILEVHDTTGYGEDSSAASLQSAVNYWIEMKDILIGEEKYIFINIGNEPFGNGISDTTWINESKNAINQLRNAGFKHTLIIDAPNWGQDWQNIMLNNAKTVFDSDILKNTVFSVHMYEVYNNYDKINNYISTFVNNKIPLIIGEFAAEHKGMDVKEYDILERCQSLGVGYLGWSWDGNSPQYGNIDIVNNWNPNSLTNWGNTLINSTNGIKNTSWKASVY
jgi:mannan endo-1,4-beta-mannosidase